MKLIGLILVIFGACPSVFGQQNISGSLISQFDRYNSGAIPEKIFVHTDRSFYSAGEVIWFKLYDVDGYLNKPLSISKVAYVDILSRDRKPVLQAKIALKDGMGMGSFLIPHTIITGNYVFRAYTSWMKNFDADYFFEKPITILNAEKKPDWDSVGNKASYDIQFFPEGGTLVAGLESRLAFRITDRSGKGLSCNGVILNERNDTLVRFQPFRFGIGQCLFTPRKGETYTAQIRMNDGELVRRPLPLIQDQGYVMTLQDGGREEIRITVRTNLGGENAMTYLFVHTRQLRKSVQAREIRNGMAEYILDKSILGDGISQLTVFNGNGQPVCERLYFKRPTAKLSIDLKTDKPEYGLRQKASLELSGKENNREVPANFSVAVFLQDSLQPRSAMDIFSYLWLTSDLKGQIESPEYYLDHSGPEVDQATDNLMLTHGWRRFRWEDVPQIRPGNLNMFRNMTAISLMER